MIYSSDPRREWVKIGLPLPAPVWARSAGEGGQRDGVKIATVELSENTIVLLQKIRNGYDIIVPGDCRAHTVAAVPAPLQQAVSLPLPEILRDRIRQHPEQLRHCPLPS